MTNSSLLVGQTASGPPSYIQVRHPGADFRLQAYPQTRPPPNKPVEFDMPEPTVVVPEAENNQKPSKNQKTGVLDNFKRLVAETLTSYRHEAKTHRNVSSWSVF